MQSHLTTPGSWFEIVTSLMTDVMKVGALPELTLQLPMDLSLLYNQKFKM